MSRNLRNSKRAGGERTPPRSVAGPWSVGWIVAGILLYLAWFLTRPLPSMAWLTPDLGPPNRLTLAFVYGSYSSLRGLATGGESPAFLDRIPLLAAVVVQIGVAWATGCVIVGRVIRILPLSMVAREAVHLAAGLHLVSLWTLVMGLCGGLQSPLWFRGPGLAVLVLAFVERIHARNRSDARPILLPSERRHTAGRIAAGFHWPWLLTLPFVGLILVLAILPPTDFDVREYHLQVPKEWYQSGRIGFLPHNVYGNMPLGAEMQALCAMGWTLWSDKDRWWYGALVGKVVMALFAPLTAILVSQLVDPSTNDNSAGANRWWSAVFLISTPWVVRIAAAGLNENALGLYLYLSFWFCQPSDSRSSVLDTASESTNGFLRRVGLAAFFLGAALSVKYTAFLYGLPFPLWVAWQGFRAKCLAKSAAVFTLVCLLSGGGWYLKNLVLSGNPVYPLAYSWFDGATRTPENDLQWRMAHHVPPDSQGNRYSLRQWSAACASFAGGSEWQHGLLIPFGVLAIVRNVWLGKRSCWGSTYWIIWMLGSWWLVTHRLERFWVPAFPWLAQLAGQGMTWSHQVAWKRYRWLPVVIALPTLWIFCASPSIQVDPRWLVPLSNLRTDPVRVNPIHLYLNRVVLPHERVLLVGDAQPFDLEVPVFYHTCFDECLLESWLANVVPQQQWQLLHDRQVRYVYYHRGEVKRYQSAGNYGFTSYVNDARFAKFVEAGVLVREPAARATVDVDAYFGELFRLAAQPPTEIELQK